MGPKLDTAGDARNTALVDHFSGFGASDGELKVGVFLPISVEQRELAEKEVVDVAHEFNGGWVRVTSHAAFEVHGAIDQRLPLLEFIFVLDLQHLVSGVGRAWHGQR